MSTPRESRVNRIPLFCFSEWHICLIDLILSSGMMDRQISSVEDGNWLTFRLFFKKKKDYGKQVKEHNVTEDIAVLGQLCAEVVPLPSTYTKCSCRVTSANYGNFFVIDFYLRLKKWAQSMFILAIRSNRCQETVSCLGSFSQISSGSTSHNNLFGDFCRDTIKTCKS